MQWSVWRTRSGGESGGEGEGKLKFIADHVGGGGAYHTLHIPGWRAAKHMDAGHQSSGPREVGIYERGS